MPMVDYDKYRGTTVDVDLAAPPAERWNDAVDEWGDECHEMMEEVVDCCKERIEELPAYWRPLVRIAGEGRVGLGGRLVGIVAKLFGQEYIAEIRGIARRAGISYPQMVLANLQYDIMQAIEKAYLVYGKVFGGACSSFSCNLPGGVPVLARNMDWGWPDTIGVRTQVVNFHRGRRHYKSVGIIGMVGVLSAMYGGKWAATLNEAPIDKLGVRYLQTPALQRLRESCDGLGGFSNFVNRLQEYQTMTPFFVHAVGCRPHQHVVVNGMGQWYEERKTEEKYLIQTNHFVGPELREYNGPDEEISAEPRYRAIRNRLRKQLPRSVKSAREKLLRQPVTNELTMQSMAFCPGRDEMMLKVRVDE